VPFYLFAWNAWLAVPWFPYPQYGVAELNPPTSEATSWNFTLLDEMLTDFMNATASQVWDSGVWLRALRATLTGTLCLSR
jgi:hypothetical protein